SVRRPTSFDLCSRDQDVIRSAEIGRHRPDLHRSELSFTSPCEQPDAQALLAGGLSPLGQTGAAISKCFDHGSIYENLQLQSFLTGQLEWAQLHGVHGLSILARACCGGKQRPRHSVVSYHCRLAPVRRAPQAQPDLLRIARIEFGDDLEAITR